MKSRLSVKDIVSIGAMIATMEAAKMALSGIVNVELVTLLMILYSLWIGRKIFYAIAAFVLIEGCLYGFGTWWFMYLYVWPLIAGGALLMRKQDSVWFWSAYSGFCGLLFGPACALTYLVIGGPAYAFSWWIAGIPVDLVHCVSNFVLMMVLYKPLRSALRHLPVSN